MFEKIFTEIKTEHIVNLFGNFDENINIVQKHYNVVVVIRDSNIKITGEKENVLNAYDTINKLLILINKNEHITPHTVRYVISLCKDGKGANVEDLSGDAVCTTVNGKLIKAKTLGQKEYIDAIRKNTIVLGVGPAGTGKTYLAVAMAVKAFKEHKVTKIILTRPAVEAGEKLGFLPGDMQDKVDPYLRPLYDALFEMLGAESYAKQVEKGNIEVAPLAYMRGRTLNDSFIILDEAQNTSSEQMKMFLTRLGFNSKMVITGDITQIDLPDVKKCGLVQCMEVLKNVDDISINKLTQKDVVRHKLVQDIILAYEKYNDKGKMN